MQVCSSVAINDPILPERSSSGDYSLNVNLKNNELQTHIDTPYIKAKLSLNGRSIRDVQAMNIQSSDAELRSILSREPRAVVTECSPNNLPKANFHQAEIYLDVILLLLLVWFLNREFEISYRLSFHGNAVAVRDKAKVQSMKVSTF